MFVAKDPNNILAAGFITLSGVFIAASTLAAKALGTGTFGDPLHPLQISQGRFIFAWMAIVTAAIILRPALTRPHWGLHISRTVCGWIGVSAMFAAVAYIPLADATAISFLNPVFAMMLAIPLLGERVGRYRWMAAAMALVGALILLRPTPASFQPAALIALGAAMIMGLELIFIKRLARREGPFQILIFNNSLGLVISSLAAFAVWQAPNPAQWAVLACVGISMAAAQACFVNGMARADASFVAPFSYATLIFAAIYDALFFDVIPDAITWAGAAIIITGAVWLAIREGRAKPTV